eukprot:TRINITY_DN32906_c0_g1_i1.p1 TRINITY_DN32906_c0_g1~~TRINITY_DN32906_c0_g1_i1.p1  ORF type:complete len:384 (+),score=135.46 TRINITY_DN32906_c0_g1_i1:55-1206(+)
MSSKKRQKTARGQKAAPQPDEPLAPPAPPADGVALTEWLRTNLQAAVKLLQNRKVDNSGDIFRQSTSTIRGYADLIKHPIDLTLMEQRAARRYLSVDEFEADMLLMQSNCIEYNGSSSARQHFVRICGDLVRLAQQSAEAIRGVYHSVAAERPTDAESARNLAAKHLREHPLVIAGVFSPAWLEKMGPARGPRPAARATPGASASKASTPSPSPAFPPSLLPQGSSGSGSERLTRNVSVPPPLLRYLLEEAATPPSPAAPCTRAAWPVDCILKEYVKRAAGEGRALPQEEVASYAAFVTSVSEALNANIAALLYPAELAAHAGGAAPSEFYGAPVLLRLLVKLPEAPSPSLPTPQHNALLLACEELLAFLHLNWKAFTGAPAA